MYLSKDTDTLICLSIVIARHRSRTRVLSLHCANEQPMRPDRLLYALADQRASLNKSCGKTLAGQCPCRVKVGITCMCQHGRMPTLALWKRF